MKTIELHQVCKTFNQYQPNEFHAIRDIDLRIEPRQATVLKGPSGSGKTTLLAMIGCLSRPTSGRITLGGETLSGLPERFMTEVRRRTFGFIFQQFNLIRGLTVSHPALGWAFVVGVVAIAGLPPLGIFMSEFLVVTSTFAREPLLAVILVVGLLVGLGALFLRVNDIAFGEPTGSTAPVKASYLPMYVHFGLVLAAGVYVPPMLALWFENVSALLG